MKYNASNRHPLNSRIAMRLVPLIAFVACAFANAHADEAGEATAGTTSRPNILFIITDDQSPWSIGAYGNTVCQTPNIDALAARGMRFDQAYHMGANLGAVCTASRHMIMTGRTVWHLPTAKVTRATVLAELARNPESRKSRNLLPNPHVPKDLPENTIGAVFNRAGYDTMRTCKIGNSYPAANKQFQVVRDATRRMMGPEGSAWHADQVIAYLDERSAAGISKNPFMIYFGFSHPHDPRYGSKELLDKYGAVNELTADAKPNQKAPKLPINYLPEHPFHHGHPGLRDEVNVQGVKRNRDEATVRNEKGREYACIENIDHQVGRVIEKLQQLGQLDNTIIIYTADHGIAVGRHGLMGKQNLYEHTWRVPYIVAGPGVQQGNAKGNIYLLDTLATICDLAGIEAPSTNEGISFRSVLEGKQETVRDVLYGCYCGGTKPGIRSVRRGDWKLIKYESLDGYVQETQLFNLAENPNELLSQHQEDEVIRHIGNQPSKMQINLAELPEYQTKVAEMESLLLSEMERLDDPYRFNEGLR